MLTKLARMTAIGLLLWLPGTVPSATAQSAANHVTFSQLKYVGTTSLSSSAAASVSSASSADRFRIAPLPKRPTGRAPTRSLLTVPTPPGNRVVNRGASVRFSGLNTADSASVNSNFVVTPPDQGLCVGNGFVVEAVNLALSVYSTSGKLLKGPIALNTFVPSDFFTTFFSDPRCYFDIPTQRWFVSVANVVDFNTGRSNFFLAVSQTSDPRGSYFIYSVDTTDDGTGGTPSNPGCPCFGDQPLLGADKNGIYISTNEFNISLIFGDPAVFNGAQIYAISKTLLEQGTLPTVVHFNLMGNSLAEGTAASLQPATSPNFEDSGEDSERRRTGVEYFLSSLDFTATLDNRIAVWAMTNTQSLNSASPNLHLRHAVISSESYGVDASNPSFSASQKPGSTPFRDLLNASFNEGDVLNELTAGDVRMQQVIYANGKLWGSLNTSVSADSGTLIGIAWFNITPLLEDGKGGTRAKDQREGRRRQPGLQRQPQGSAHVGILPGRAEPLERQAGYRPALDVRRVEGIEEDQQDRDEQERQDQD